MLSPILLRSFAFVSLVLAPSIASMAQEPFDLVIAGGRVIDPESGLDAIRHVGVRGDRIAEVSVAPLKGRETLDAAGLVVAPGSSTFTGTHTAISRIATPPAMA